jgi:ubiquinone/menaquinone biosynthesis C-methylase UbiE
MNILSQHFRVKGARAFDRWSEDYDAQAKEMIGRRGYSYRLLAEQIVNYFGPNTMNVLEIGTGPGTLGREVFSLVGMPFIGVDISAKMLKRASCTGAYSSLIRASAEELPLSDNAFDAVFTTFVMHSVCEQEQALSEIYRILSPGGIGILVDLFPTGRPTWKAILLGYFHSLRNEHGAPARYAPIECFLGKLLDAGFCIRMARPIGEARRYQHFFVAFIKPTWRTNDISI